MIRRFGWDGFVTFVSAIKNLCVEDVIRAVETKDGAVEVGGEESVVC